MLPVSRSPGKARGPCAPGSSGDAPKRPVPRRDRPRVGSCLSRHGEDAGRTVGRTSARHPRRRGDRYGHGRGRRRHTLPEPATDPVARTVPPRARRRRGPSSRWPPRASAGSSRSWPPSSGRRRCAPPPSSPPRRPRPWPRRPRTRGTLPPSSPEGDREAVAARLRALPGVAAVEALGTAGESARVTLVSPLPTPRRRSAPPTTRARSSPPCPVAAPGRSASRARARAAGRSPSRTARARTPTAASTRPPGSRTPSSSGPTPSPTRCASSPTTPCGTCSSPRVCVGRRPRGRRPRRGRRARARRGPRADEPRRRGLGRRHLRRRRAHRPRRRPAHAPGRRRRGARRDAGRARRRPRHVPAGPPAHGDHLGRRGRRRARARRRRVRRPAARLPGPRLDRRRRVRDALGFVAGAAAPTTGTRPAGACAPDDLALGALGFDAAAGRRFLTVTARNDGAAECVLAGAPAVRFVADDGAETDVLLEQDDDGLARSRSLRAPPPGPRSRGAAGRRPTTRRSSRRCSWPRTRATPRPWSGSPGSPASGTARPARRRDRDDRVVDARARARELTRVSRTSR